MQKESICLYAGYLYYPLDKIHFFDENSLYGSSLGGSDTWLLYMSRYFSKIGFEVTVVCDCERYHIDEFGIIFLPVVNCENTLKKLHFNYLIVNNEYCAVSAINADMKLIAIHNTNFNLFGTELKFVNGTHYDYILYLSEFQKNIFIEKYGLTDTAKFKKIKLGIETDLYKDFSFYEKKNKMVWSSHKHRGLRFFIERVFPLIRQRVPDFELEVCSYIDDVGGEFDGVDGVTYLGSLTKNELAERQKESKIWVYPNTGVSDDKTFDGETFCLTAIENAAAGNAVVVADRHGFSDTLKGYSGFVGYECFADGSHVVDGEDNLSLFAEILAERAVELLTNEEYRLSLVNELQGICKDYTIENSGLNVLNVMRKGYERCMLSLNMLRNTTRRLVFHFWVPRIKTQLYHDINNIHLECLKRFIDRFNESVFVLACDDTEDEYINFIKEKIYETKPKGELHIKIIKNDDIYREAITFNDEIMHKLDKLDGVTFFAHNKGTSRVNYNHIEVENLKKWILYMYYNNLNSITQVLNRLFSPRCLCYGAPLFFNVSNEYTMTKNEWLYLGAFQWIHTKKLYDYLGYNKVGYDSFDAESFIPNKVEKHHDLIGSLNSNFAYANVDRLYDLVSDTDFFNYVLYSQYEDGFDEFCIDIFNKF